jgi:transcription initiation factor IIE alpha subunit
MTLALLSCPNCGSDFDAKKRREMLRQIESIVSGKQNEKPN